MIVSLRAPTREECQLVRDWRNAPDVLPMLRTGAKTEAEQDAFYEDVVCNPEAPHRYYAIAGPIGFAFFGLGGLTHLDRTSGEGEISLILAPLWRGEGLGELAIDALLAQAFDKLDLMAVVGECYAQSPAWAFWQRQLARRDCGVSAWVNDAGSLWWRWTRRRTGLEGDSYRYVERTR